MELKEAVKIATKYCIINAGSTDTKHLRIFIDLAKRYLAIEGKRLVPKEKKEVYVGEDRALPYAKQGAHNACRQECILRIMKNMLSVAEIDEIVLEAHIGKVSQAIYDEYEKKIMGRSKNG